jgi:hypothetical protein
VAKTLQRWFVVCAVILGMGAHWAILQSVAWTGMVFSYSQHTSFSEALQKTFDGEHPCKICKVVKAGRDSERKQPQQNLSLKLDLFVFGVSGQALFPRLIEADLPTVIDQYSSAKDSPPTPPPLIG